MTPTNDAPVTVEQCDREAAADLMIAINASDGLERQVDPWRTGAYDKRHLVRAFARHRLAALASAPAGDGVEDAFRQALEDVCNPLGYLQRKAEADGARLGGMAYAIANDIATVQGIARDALAAALASAPAGDGVEEAAVRYMAAVKALGARSDIDAGRNLFDERPMSEAGVAAWRELNDAGKALSAALARPPAAVGVVGRIPDGQTFSSFVEDAQERGTLHKLGWESDIPRAAVGEWSYDIDAAPKNTDLLVYRPTDGGIGWRNGGISIALRCDDKTWEDVNGDDITPPIAWAALQSPPAKVGEVSATS